MHTAHNVAYANISTELNTCIDSDDKLADCAVEKILTEDGVEQESAPHPKQVLYVDLGIKVDEYDILRRQEEETSISLE